MADYNSIHSGSVIDGAVSAVINGEAGIQGVKVNGEELEPDSDNKVDITVPTFTHTTSSIDTAVTRVNSNLAGIQGVKVNGTALVPDAENKVDVLTIPQTEVGSWSPTLVSSASYLPLPTFTYTTREAKYYRLGKVCYITLNLRLNVTSVPASVSGIVIDGLPYASASDISVQSIPIGHVINTNPNPGGFGEIKNGSSQIRVFNPSNNVLTAFAVSTTEDIIYSGFYIINSTYY